MDTLPKTEEELQALSGIGEYTAGAIMAFAYDIFVPILETNIRTVLCHHFCQKDVSSMCPALSLYPALTTKLFTESKQSPRHFYEAMMDYGAFLKKEKVTVCKKIAKQKAFKGSKRELRAKLLYLITENKMLEMDDSRSEAVLLDLVQEGFIRKSSKGYEIVL